MTNALVGHLLHAEHLGPSVPPTAFSRFPNGTYRERSLVAPPDPRTRRSS